MQNSNKHDMYIKRQIYDFLNFINCIYVTYEITVRNYSWKNVIQDDSLVKVLAYSALLLRTKSLEEVDKFGLSNL